MAFDEALAARVRALLVGEPAVTEKKLFGGLAFLVGGQMAVTASAKGGLMVCVAPEEKRALLALPGVGPVVMGGREMRGWLRVDAEAVRTRGELESWVRRGLAGARGR